MKSKWRLQHIIDMEYFFRRDQELNNTELHLRDRNIFLTKAENMVAQKNPSSHQLIKKWLAIRSDAEFTGPEQRSPGAIFEDSLFIAGTVSLGVGLATGLTAGLTFFTYSGATPVNVFHFLFFFVFSQLALIAFLAGGFLLKLIFPGLKVPSFYSLLLRTFARRAIISSHKKWQQSFDADKRDSIRHTFGIIRSKGKSYGRLFYWPLFSIVQLAGVGFNVALLTVTLLKIATSDLAFGWQSTLQLSNSAIYQAVKIMALPWAWFIPPVHSYPSLEQIEGSRIILKEGIFHLTTADLVAWWPFLVFCLLFYGLFFRLCLLSLSSFLKYRSLKEPPVDTPACIALVRRMLTPTVTTQAKPEGPGRETELPQSAEKTEVTPPRSHLQPLTVLIPDDIYDLCSTGFLEDLLRTSGYDILLIERFMIGYDEDKELLQHLGERAWQNDEGILLLIEGWMPPLVDFISFLGDLRSILPEPRIISLALVGRPNADKLTPAADQDFTIWKKKVGALGDPYLEIFSLIS
ncbi:MAG: DUF2868 domain-containing protein [Desulforhopalus sp.]